MLESPGKLALHRILSWARVSGITLRLTGCEVGRGVCVSEALELASGGRASVEAAVRVVPAAALVAVDPGPTAGAPHAAAARANPTTIPKCELRLTQPIRPAMMVEQDSTGEPLFGTDSIAAAPVFGGAVILRK
jgi:hypothetical protein